MIRSVAEHSVAGKREILQPVRVAEVAEVAQSVCIGKYDCDEELHLYSEYRRLGLTLDNTVRLGDLSNAETIQRIREAPRIVLSNLNRDGSDLLYCPYGYPADEEVFLNQRAALYGEIAHVKLFAISCNTGGQIMCYFYNEQTQLLSTGAFNKNSTPYEPVCFAATCDQERYLVMCDGHLMGTSGALGFVLRYDRDAQGKLVYKRTYLYPLDCLS